MANRFALPPVPGYTANPADLAAAWERMESYLLDSDPRDLSAAWESCGPAELADILSGLGFDSETAGRAAFRSIL